ncbi:MAG: hypothetical protein JXB17_04665 [Bacteroidales bacterium]|nr:hypothetical protein [Bacteroidales bacterium]
MKNAKYNIGIFSTIVVTTGSVFKIMHWPGAGIIFTLGIMCICFLFFPLAFISAYKNDGKNKSTLYIAAFITVFSDFTGALFKIMHWPGAGVFLTIGILAPAVIFLPVYIYYHFKEKEESITNFMYIMFLLVYLSGMSALLALNISKSILDKSIAITEINNLDDYYQLKNKQFLNIPDTGKISDVRSKTEHLLNTIHDIKKNLLISGSEENKSSIDDNNRINPWEVKTLDNIEVVTQVMLMEENAYILRKEINEYHNYLISVINNSNSSIINFYDDLLSTQASVINDENYSWEIETFGQLHLIFAINKLTEIENNIRLAELEALTILSKNKS